VELFDCLRPPRPNRRNSTDLVRFASRVSTLQLKPIIICRPNLTTHVTKRSSLGETANLRIRTWLALRLAAVSIWASWIVAVRLGIRTSLAPWDIVAIRFGVAGLILLPYLLKKGLAVDRLGWAGLAAIMLDGGAPMVLVSYGGLLFAPAAHAASLYTALIPLYVAILAAVVLGEAFTVAKRIGLVLIVTGVLGIVWGAGGTIGSRQNIGHAMFISAGILWACYIVAMRKARLDSNQACTHAAVSP
jgi:drug/metabolite transporter (DMT)-like permease